LQKDLCTSVATHADFIRLAQGERHGGSDVLCKSYGICVCSYGGAQIFLVTLIRGHLRPAHIVYLGAAND